MLLFDSVIIKHSIIMKENSSDIYFTKMHGLGNDYLYINCLSQPLHRPDIVSRYVSHRNFGVGSDGIILICPSDEADCDFKMRIFNSDGSEAGNCGNGLRCFGKYLYDKGITQNKTLRVQTKGAKVTIELTVHNDKVDSVRVNMGQPVLSPQQIPTTLPGEQIINQDFIVENFSGKINCVSMGNPHAVFFVDKITDDMVHRIGPHIENHKIFPSRVNVEFVEVISPTHLKMRVWERGSGETMACGTGACAVLVSAVLNDKSERKAQIELLGGILEIEWSAEDNMVYQRGPAEFVCDGVISTELMEKILQHAE